jgi:hypothetical protein
MSRCASRFAALYLTVVRHDVNRIARLERDERGACPPINIIVNYDAFRQA